MGLCTDWNYTNFVATVATEFLAKAVGLAAGFLGIPVEKIFSGWTALFTLKKRYAQRMGYVHLWGLGRSKGASPCWCTEVKQYHFNNSKLGCSTALAHSLSRYMVLRNCCSCLNLVLDESQRRGVRAV
uniref:Uncharacterized protein n=1 Tax=Trichuris muris TaxID=70415 RepID=A0A5S6QSQ5_TRIMR